MTKKMQIDIQCGSCSALAHHSDPPPKFCSCCGASFERYCLKCHRRGEMFFEEWWPEDDECLRTYSPAKRCSGCNAQLANEGQSGHGEHGGGYTN